MTTPLSYFERLYAGSRDPWSFETRWYEARKHALTLEALPARHYRSGFEPGCSTGMLTTRLAARCDRLLAVDAVEAAARTAARRVADRPQVSVRAGRMPQDWPDENFDLIVLSELGYYFDDTDLALLLDRVAGSLPRSLAALRIAATLVTPVPVRLIVVADACTDDTALLADAGGAEVVRVNERNVGRARRAGMAHALNRGPQWMWLATTDADSEVPAEWLRWQLRHANAGTDLLAGTVEVDDWSGWPPALPGRYESRYRRRPGHIHGANLGVSAAAYLATGGFPGLVCDEDQTLVARAIAAGRRVVLDDSCPVRTSARPDGRAPRGFAAHLRALATEC
ncbi:methyltransferase domain-containing protein [Actinoplanes sp. KI2]|uniref:SAM-dependent methyltransferase n=1 Tax=Actinoplanes sp. KI2 TaxID=2983315 RepID=UPI0021D5CFC9|nr:SAM-dependent methyltransferase [Actinoplanes sp. KI2]MCU7728334.1 methyltransferase domain-containing protein [Actinoplanes sp. KI2]